MSVTFTYETTVLTLPNPEFGDIDRVDANAVSRTNRQNEAIVYKDGDWPVFRTKQLAFKTLTQDEVDALLAFLDVAVARNITYVDYNGVTWSGMIVTSDPEIITLRDECSYDVSFEYMGQEVT